MTQSTTMRPPKSYQSADDLRRALIARIDTFCQLTGTSRSKLGLAVLNDNHSVHDIEDGRDIRLDTYQKFQSYLDAHWPREPNSLCPPSGGPSAALSPASSRGRG